MYYTDYHNHSILSFDGQVPLRTMAEHMQKAGMQEMCLTDHFDLLDENAQRCYDFDWKAAWKQYDETWEEFKDKGFVIKQGLEYGMGHIDPPVSERILAQPRLDFIIGSIHNMSPEHSGDDFYRYDLANDIPLCHQVLNDYFSSMEKLVQTPYFDILGHVIYPLRYMNPAVTAESYMDRIAQILRTVITSGRGMEVNTYKGQTIGEWAPVLKLFKDLGGELVTVGSDAHNPIHAGLGIPEAYDLLKTLGFKAVCTYHKRKPIFHDL